MLKGTLCGEPSPQLHDLQDEKLETGSSTQAILSEFLSPGTDEWKGLHRRFVEEQPDMYEFTATQIPNS